MAKWRPVPKSDPQSRWEVLEDQSKKLGEGGFGNVFRGKDKGAGDSRPARDCAAKKVSLADPTERQAFECELTMLKAVAGHQSIIELFGHLQNGTEGWIFLEMATGGELFDRLIDSKSLSLRAPLPAARDAARDAATRRAHPRGAAPSVWAAAAGD